MFVDVVGGEFGYVELSKHMNMVQFSSKLNDAYFFSVDDDKITRTQKKCKVR